MILHAVASGMVSDDMYILAAMDGQEVSPKEAGRPKTDDRDEPTAFFHILFGLVFEALVTSDPNTDLVAKRTSVISLQALRCLVQRKYCGKAFQDSAIFDELISLCYRMALTEPSTVLVYLVDAVSALAQNLASSSRKNGLLM